MSHYVTQFAYTAETWAVLRSNPTDRTGAINALAEKLGCRLINPWNIELRPLRLTHRHNGGVSARGNGKWQG